MRASSMFNTLEFMNNLKDAGIDQKHAEAITNASEKAFRQLMDNKELATKSDLKQLELSTKADLKELELSTKADLKQLELTTKSELKSMEITLRKEISETMWKTIGILATFQTLILGIFGLIQFMSK